MQKTNVIIALVLACAVLGMTWKTDRVISVEGAWRVVEVQTFRPNGQVTSIVPSESVVLFASGHYSFCWTSHQSLSQGWQISDTERVVRFNSTLINAGTYEFADSHLVTHAQFALQPKFVGGSATFRVIMSGDTLVLSGTNVLAADNTQHPTYAAGAHIVSKLVPAR